MSSNPHIAMIRAVIGTMVLVFGTIAQFLLLSPVLYTVLNISETQFNSQATNVDAITWGPRIYLVLNAAYGMLTILAVLVEIAACYLYARHIYYASGEVSID